jgi:hypothetical protein
MEQVLSNMKFEEIDYYIITIQYEPAFWPERGIIGPLSLNRFKEKTKELSIDAIFEVHY